MPQAVDEMEEIEDDDQEEMFAEVQKKVPCDNTRLRVLRPLSLCATRQATRHASAPRCMRWSELRSRDTCACFAATHLPWIVH